MNPWTRLSISSNMSNRASLNRYELLRRLSLRHYGGGRGRHGTEIHNNMSLNEVLFIEEFWRRLTYFGIRIQYAVPRFPPTTMMSKNRTGGRRGYTTSLIRGTDVLMNTLGLN